MLVYRSTSRRVGVPEALEEMTSRLRTLAVARAPDHELVRSLLIDAGELEAALIDRECPDQDDSTPLTRALDAWLVRLGAAFVASWSGRAGLRELWRPLREALAEMREHAPRDVIAVAVPEGFAFYGLFPESYIAPAKELARRRSPSSVLVIGIRGIGTTLSAVVAAALLTEAIHVDRVTVRPRGHPFDRELRLTGRLTSRIRSRIGTDGVVAIVDEGPGISGSSFASVAECVSRLGVGDERIVFLPSWNPSPGALRNQRARERWSRHTRFLEDFDSHWMARAHLERRFDAEISHDLSAGAWRERVYASAGEYPAVQPQHERRKYLATRADGEQLLVKFEGLGRYGETSVARARRIAAAGFGPPVRAHHDGFTATKWIRGIPMRRQELTVGFLRRVAEYLAWVHRHERTGGSADPDPLIEMLELNVREGLGGSWTGAVRQVASAAEPVRRAPAVRLDNRMMPHEWLRTADGFIKTDNASHFDDHFYPGPHDSAWDVAGACVELELDGYAEGLLIAEYSAASNDHDVGRRLRFLRPAYLAFRLGYTTMAAESLGDAADGRRMRVEASRYAAALRHELADGLEPQQRLLKYGQSHVTGV